MPYFSNQRGLTPEKWKAQIEKAADELSNRYSLGKKRVRDIYFKIDSAGIEVHGFPNESPLKRAINLTDKKRALQLFEETDISVLMNRVSLFHRFLYPDFAPFYTHDELADLIGAFIESQKDSKDKIIKTGFPKRAFEKSIWLDQQLGRLYYLKLPLDYPRLPRYYYSCPALKKVDQIFNTQDADEQYTIWIKNPPEIENETGIKTIYPFHKCYILFNLGDFYFENDKFYNKDGYVVAQNCEFGDAPYLDIILNDPDWMEIIALREQLFDMRVEILEVLREAFRKGQPAQMWEDCLSIMVDKYELQSEQVEMLNRFDSILRCSYQDKDEYEIGGKKFPAAHLRLISGVPDIHINHPYRFISKFENNSGFGDLIHFIGWCKIQIETGEMNEAKKRLLDFTIDDKVFSYYQLLNKPWIKILDTILDDFAVNSEMQKKRFDGFYEQVRESQRSKLLVPVESSKFWSDLLGFAVAGLAY